MTSYSGTTKRRPRPNLRTVLDTRGTHGLYVHPPCAKTNQKALAAAAATSLLGCILVWRGITSGELGDVLLVAEENRKVQQLQLRQVCAFLRCDIADDEPGKTACMIAQMFVFISNSCHPQSLRSLSSVTIAGLPHTASLLCSPFATDNRFGHHGRWQLLPTTDSVRPQGSQPDPLVHVRANSIRCQPYGSR